MAKIQTIGFGFLPQETMHNFIVRVPRSKNDDVVVYERFKWNEEEKQSSDIIEKNIKVIIPIEKWDAVKVAVEREFNRRLKEGNMLVCKFKIGDNILERLFGKELTLLLWAIEDSDPALIPVAIKNWLGLSPEERWWLFTMANAATGHYAKKRGWRIAIRYALTDNPINESNVQTDLWELLNK